jgi:hypothetical protein
VVNARQQGLGDPRPEPDSRLSRLLVSLLSFRRGPHEEHICSNPAVKTRAPALTATTPPYRRGTRGLGKQLERRITQDVRSRSPQDQPGAEKAVGEAQDSETEAHDLGRRAQADRGSAAGTVGEGEEGGIKELQRRAVMTAASVLSSSTSARIVRESMGEQQPKRVLFQHSPKLLEARWGLFHNLLPNLSKCGKLHVGLDPLAPFNPGVLRNPMLVVEEGFLVREIDIPIDGISAAGALRFARCFQL